MSIKIALIGCGRAGMIHGRNFARHVSGARLTALVDASAAALATAGQELGVDQRYRDVNEALDKGEFDAVVVAAPSSLHRDIVVAAAGRGKHILCEKPMGMNEQECDDMILAADRAGVKLQMGFMRRFDAGFVAAREIVRRGDIGDVVLVKSLTRGPSIPKPWMYDVASSNGPLSEVNSHDIDSLRWFSGSEFAEVYAIAGNFRSPAARENYPQFYDNVLMTARFANGMQGCIDGAQAVLYGYDSRLEVLGTKGMVSVGSLAANTVCTYTAGAGAQQPVVKSWTALFEQAYRAEDVAFVECIKADCQPAVVGKDGKMAVAVVNAGNRSIIEKKPIKLL